MTEERWDWSRQGHVAVDVGGDAGALVILAGPERDGAEIQLGSEVPSAICHAQVHPRFTSSAVVYGAVFPCITAGSYAVWWPGAEHRAQRVSIAPGIVTQLRID